jgi:glutathione-regulated potassium-efflux system ancillary protein KefG
MLRILILFAHPALRKSRVQRALLAAVPRAAGITLHDLYDAYPDYDIDVPREQALLLDHDLVIMQHPFYWYSTPPILKQWQDLVLEHGWAYGAGGRALQGKTMLNVLSTGGPERSYSREGAHRRTIRELLAPVEQTARLCRMNYLPPYVIYGSHRLEPPDIEAEATRYGEFLRMVQAGTVDLAAFAAAGEMHDTLAQALAAPLGTTEAS